MDSFEKLMERQNNAWANHGFAVIDLGKAKSEVIRCELVVARHLAEYTEFHHQISRAISLSELTKEHPNANN